VLHLQVISIHISSSTNEANNTRIITWQLLARKQASGDPKFIEAGVWSKTIANDGFVNICHINAKLLEQR
jgi:hypothetical protein